MRLCDTVRQTARNVHVYHGNGRLETVCENALANRLQKLGPNVKRQYPIKVYDGDGTLLGEYLADLVMDSCLIVELKACKTIIDEHIAQTLGYLKSSRIDHGLLINFRSHKFQIKKLLGAVARPSLAQSFASLFFSLFGFFAFFRG